MKPGRVEKLLIGIISLHSIVLGGALLASPGWVLGLAGWKYDGDVFFPAQSGIFLIILGGAYAVAIRRRSFACLLAATKAVAVTFLLAAYAMGWAPPVVLAAAAIDGVMGGAVAVILMRKPEVWDARRP